MSAKRCLGSVPLETGAVKHRSPSPRSPHTKPESPNFLPKNGPRNTGRAINGIRQPTRTVSSNSEKRVLRSKADSRPEGWSIRQWVQTPHVEGERGKRQGLKSNEDLIQCGPSIPQKFAISPAPRKALQFGFSLPIDVISKTGTGDEVLREEASPA